MTNSAKIWIIIAILLLVTGIIIFTAVMVDCKWDFLKLNTSKYETNTYELSGEFSNVYLNTDTAKINFLPSEDEKTKVVCFEEQNAKHSVAIIEDTLTINVVNNKAWYEYIGLNLNSPKITVYLPLSNYRNLFIKESTGDIQIPDDFTFEEVELLLSTGDVKSRASAKNIKIKTDTGDIELENLSAENIDLSVSTGETSLENVRCKNLTSSGSTGDIELENVIAEEKINITRSTGDIELENCDAGSFDISADTGDVTGSLLSEKIFIASADTGKVRVPNTHSGGECKIHTNTGDIRINLAN